MERQQTLVRRAMERTAAPGMEEPAQVRRLARAVMKELEGQLRLERQQAGREVKPRTPISSPLARTGQKPRASSRPSTA